MIKSLDTALLQEFPLHAFAVHFTLHTSVRLTHFVPPSFVSRASVVVCPPLSFKITSFYSLLVSPFTAVLCLCRHKCLATVSFYFQHLLMSLSSSYYVVLWIILRAFLACVFTPMEWSVPVNDFMSWPHLCYFALCIIHLRARAALVCVCVVCEFPSEKLLALPVR